jgi:pimeloyl-ACP methyl ester carboxylesterase
VIFVDYPGVSCSSGAFGPQSADTACLMIAFLTALDLSAIELLGFSIGGLVAPEMAPILPALVRRAWSRVGDCREPAAHLLRARRDQPRQGPRVPLALQARHEDRDPPSSLRAG